MLSLPNARPACTVAVVALATLGCSSGSPTASHLGVTPPTSAASVQLSVSDNTYPVTVLTSSGTFFSECFIFNGDGSFSSGTGLTGTWEEVGGDSGLWSATTTSGGGLDIRWNGLDFNSTFLSGFGIRLADSTIYRVFGRSGSCSTNSSGRAYAQ